MGVYLMLMAEGGRYASAKAEENGDRIVFAKLTRQKATVSVGILCLGATILIQIPLLRSHQRILDKRYYQSRNFPDAVPCGADLTEGAVCNQGSMEYIGDLFWAGWGRP